MQSGMFQSRGDPTASLPVARSPDTEYQILRPFLALIDPRPKAILHEPGDKLINVGATTGATVAGEDPNKRKSAA